MNKISLRKPAARFILRNIVILASLCAVVTLGGAENLVSVEITKDNVFTFYRTFRRLTKEPRLIAPLTSFLWAIRIPEVLVEEKKMTGPHYEASVPLYANGLAEAVIVNARQYFPRA